LFPATDIGNRVSKGVNLLHFRWLMEMALIMFFLSSSRHNLFQSFSRIYRLRLLWDLAVIGLSLVAMSCGSGSKNGTSSQTPGPSTTSRTYTTDFPLAENPISEGGKWINGAAVGLDWSNVQTTHGLAFDVSGAGYNDGTALLAGSWGPDQTVQVTVHCTNQSSAIYQEVEIRLRSSLSAHVATGYEVNARCLRGDPASYLYIVRWNGPFGDFTTLAGATGAQYGVTDGDVLKATIIGQVITVYVNGNQMMTFTDGTYATGSPGMGFDLTNTSTFSDFGITSFSAHD